MRSPLLPLLAAALFAAGAAPATAQQRWDFDRLDRNRDGRVTWSEYRRGAPSWEGLGLDRNGRLEQRSSRTDQTGRFERRDDRRGDRRDGRGENRGEDRGRDTRNSLAARHDLNRDGRVTRSEYQRALRAEFRRLDRNRDGAITRREAASGGSERFDRVRSDRRGRSF